MMSVTVIRPCRYYGSGEAHPGGKEIPEEMLEQVADDAALQAILMKEVGFDGVYIHMSYRAMPLAKIPLSAHQQEER